MRGESLNGRLTELVGELVDRGLTLEQARKQFEKQFILASLKSNKGNFTRSAVSLGVHRNTLRNKVSTLGIGSEDVAAGRQAKKRSRARRAPTSS